MKLDTSRIENYDNMSAEEKLAALESYEFDTKGYVKKDLFDKTASELAALKKEYKGKLSEEEQKQAERDEQFAAMQNELNVLKEEKQLSEMTARYLSLGYDEKLAEDTAKAMVKGDVAKVFANQKTHQDSIAQKVKTDILKDTPKPGAGSGSQTMTKEAFRKLSVAERLAFSTEHPDEYKQIYKGE